MISPGQQFTIAHHIANGRPDLALIAGALPASVFAELDDLMRAAWLAGARERSIALGRIPDVSQQVDDSGEGK